MKILSYRNENYVQIMVFRVVLKHSTINNTVQKIASLCSWMSKNRINKNMHLMMIDLFTGERQWIVQSPHSQYQVLYQERGL